MEQKKEAIYLINDERYLHLRENGAGVGFATYNKVTGEPLESGQISEKNLPPDGRNMMSAARNWYLFELSDDDRLWDVFEDLYAFELDDLALIIRKFKQIPVPGSSNGVFAIRR